MEQIKHDPFITKLLEKIPSSHRDSFSSDQLLALKAALGARSWGKHKVDLRGTLRFWRWQYYFVFLFGLNSRDLTRREQDLTLMAKAIGISLFILFSVITGLLFIYLIKSAMGIDLFPNFHLGVWDWFIANFQ